MNQALQYYSLVLDILRVTYFLIWITMPDPQIVICVKYGKWCQRFLNGLCCAGWGAKLYSLTPLASVRLSKLWILCLNDLLLGDLCKNFFYFHIFSFLVFKHDFIRFVDFTHIAVSNTASDDVTNEVIHRTFNTDLLSSFAHFVVETYGKYSHNGGV